MSDEQVLDMPALRFWMMQSNINRVSAERDMRSLTMYNSAMSSEGAGKYRESLELEMGNVTRVSDTLDREGLELLRSM